MRGSALTTDLSSGKGQAPMSDSSKGTVIAGDGCGFARIEAVGAACGPLGSSGHPPLDSGAWA